MAQQNMSGVFYATTYHPIQAGSIDGTDFASHDNGVYRALLASTTGLYDPTGDPKAEGDPYTTLFVGRLAHHTTEKTLHEAMSKYGRVKHLRLVRHIVTGASRGYAFVEFETENDMQNAYEVAQHHKIDGSQILVDYNRQQLMPGWIPRRLGGGLGGHKESGQLRFGGRDRPFRAPLRTIPSEQLIKLGIPLPPVGPYGPRLLAPPTPRRSGSLKRDASYYKHKSSYKENPSQETLPTETLGDNEREGIKHHAEFSPRQSRQPADAGSGPGTHREHRIRQAAARDTADNLSDKGDSGHEDENQHKRRHQSEHRDECADRQNSSMSGHEDRSSRHHKRSLSRSSHKDRNRDRHERSTSRSRQRDRDSGHHGRSTSRSEHKDRESGYLHRWERELRGSTANYDRSPKHGNEESGRSPSKYRRRNDEVSHVKEKDHIPREFS